MKAMAQALPDKVIATGFDCTTAFCLSRLGENGYSVYLEIFGGGYGASKGADGCDAVDSPLSNCSNAPVESLDIDYDFFRIVGYELAPDSFGLGARRGGAGFFRRCEILRDDVQLAIYSDRSGWRPRAFWAASPASAATAASSAPTARPRTSGARPPSTSPKATSWRCSSAAVQASAWSPRGPTR